MSDLINAGKALYFGSFLYNQNFLEIEDLKNIWEERFGPSVEFIHPYYPMKEYYSKQMGDSINLKRVLLASLVPDTREKLIEHKIWADNIEKGYSKNLNLRPLNLDIGLLTLENLVLATGKSFSHRIYLGSGVYADLNLIFEQKTMKALPWAYPDYSNPDFIHFFNWLRGFLYRKNSEKIT